jgi:tetratricopeptide (TPR) repeat protein
MWPSRISLLLARPPKFVALAPDPHEGRVFSGNYLRLDAAPYGLGRRIARGDEAIVFELVNLRLGYCAGVVKICRYKPGTKRYAAWAVTRRDERNPHSNLPDVELHPARLVPVPGGVVKVQPYVTPSPETAWATHAPIADVLAFLEEGRSGDALRLAELLLGRFGRHGVLLEARGLALDRLGRIDEARTVLEDALEAHIKEGNAARLHTAYILARVLQKLYRRSAGSGGATLSIELPDGTVHTQTAFASVEDAAADDTLEDRAVFVLLEALASEPYFTGGLLGLGGYIANAPAAVDTLRAIVAALERFDPADPDVTEFAAFIRGRYGDGREEPAEPVDPVADVHVPSNLSAEAGETLERFDELYQPEPTRARQAAARHDAAWLHAGSGRFAAAERELREAVDLDPDDVDYRLLLAHVLESQLKTDEARRVLEETTRRFADDARGYEALGDLCIVHEDLAEAKLAYLRALGTEPDERWSIELKVGEAFRLQGEYGRALDFFRVANAHAPDEPWTIIAFVQALRAPALDADGDPMDNNDFKEGLAIVDDALRRMPSDAPLLICAAQSYLAAGRYHDARDALRRAVECDPDHSFAAQFLSELEHNLRSD